MRSRDNWSVKLTIVFGVVVVSLIAATCFSQWQLATVGRSSRDIADNFAPSIEYLAEARGDMRRLQIVLREYIDERKTEPTARVDAVEDARTTMDDAITSYLVLPSDAKERQLAGDVLRAKDAMNLAVERCLEKTAQRDFPATDVLMRNVSAAADVLSMAITRDIELNAGRSHESAARIARTYDRSTQLAGALALLCIAITLTGAVALRRAIRAHTRLQERHQSLVEARASELEQFAGRVAHDILSPLGVVSLMLGVVNGKNMNEQARAQLIVRASSAIKRIDRLVSGLLAFAVAGAQPDEGVAADVAAVIADLAPELRAAATDVGVDLEASVDVSSLAACHPGVLTSIVSNLARNAIKYIGDGRTRRVEVRATESRKVIRLEVEDTGPGLAADLEPHVFDPYVRGKEVKKGGIGLGLATVKRVVTAHGGTVGVKSISGVGCTFWVELPKHIAAAQVGEHHALLQLQRH